MPTRLAEHLSSWRWDWALVVMTAVLASLTSLLNDFALDDIPLIVVDARVHSFARIGEILTSPYWPEPFHPDLYRPLATLSFTAQWVLGGGSPLAFRLTSILLYALASLAVLVLARRLLPFGVALGAAVLFAAHPVHVEAVALGVNQGELWVALAVVGSTIVYLDARRRGYPTRREWTLIAAAYGLACLFKEHAFVLPGILVAAEVTLVGDEVARERARRLWPGFATLGAVGVAYLTARTAVLGDLVGAEPSPVLAGLDIGARSLTMLQVVPEWARLLVWPVRLLGDYSIAVIERSSGWGAPETAGLVVLAGALALALLHRRRAPVVGFGLLFAGLALVPVANVLVPTTIVLAERTLFLPSVGFVLATGGVANGFLTRQRPILARFAALAVAVLAALWVARSGVRHTDWRNHPHFWARTAQDAPENHKAYHALGQMLFQAGEDRAAIHSFHRALALFPEAYWISHELGDWLRDMGHCRAALPLYAESLRVEPDQPVARLSRIECLRALGRDDEAQAEVERARALSEGPPAGSGG